MRKIALISSILAVVFLIVLNLTYNFDAEPDAVFPMANQRIEWYYAGK